VNDLVKTKKIKLLDCIIQSSEHDFWIHRPNVAVKMTLYSNSNTRLRAYGFAKVSHPDEWNLEFGISLAVRKASAFILKQAKKKGVDLNYLIAKEGESYLLGTAVQDPLEI